MENVIVPSSQARDLRIETSRFMLFVPSVGDAMGDPMGDARAIRDLVGGESDVDRELRSMVLLDEATTGADGWKPMVISKLGRPDQILGVQYFREIGGGSPLQTLTAFRLIASSAVARRHASAAALQLAFIALEVEVVATRVAVDNEAARATAWAHGFEEVGKSVVTVDGAAHEFIDLELTAQRYSAARPPTSVQICNPRTARSVLGLDVSRTADGRFGR